MEIADPGHHRVDPGRPLGMLTQLVGLGSGGSGDDELDGSDVGILPPAGGLNLNPLAICAKL
jgi:hypothetical protein